MMKIKKRRVVVNFFIFSAFITIPVVLTGDWNSSILGILTLFFFFVGTEGFNFFKEKK